MSNAINIKQEDLVTPVCISIHIAQPPPSLALSHTLNAHSLASMLSTWSKAAHKNDYTSCERSNEKMKKQKINIKR